MVKPPMRIGNRASKHARERLTLPVSRPMAMVKDLKVEPISNVPFDMRFNQPSSAPSAGLFGIEIRARTPWRELRRYGRRARRRRQPIELRIW